MRVTKREQKILNLLDKRGELTKEEILYLFKEREVARDRTDGFDFVGERLLHCLYNTRKLDELSKNLDPVAGIEAYRIFRRWLNTKEYEEAVEAHLADLDDPDQYVELEEKAEPIPQVRILNLTQHTATPEQSKMGVLDLHISVKRKVKELLMFTETPEKSELQARACELVSIVKKYDVTDVLIGGAPFFMSTLEKELINAGFRPVYALDLLLSPFGEAATV